LFREQDFAESNSFSLAWRWTCPDFWQASEFELQLIRPLDPAVARKLWIELCQKTFGKVSDLPAFFSTEIIECQTSGNSTQVAQWLASVWASEPSQVVVFWEPEEAIVTEKDLFSRHWDDFCYPSVDDVVVWPVDGSWVLFFDHEEVFRFKRK